MKRVAREALMTVALPAHDRVGCRVGGPVRVEPESLRWPASKGSNLPAYPSIQRVGAAANADSTRVCAPDVAAGHPQEGRDRTCPNGIRQPPLTRRNGILMCLIITLIMHEHLRPLLKVCVGSQPCPMTAAPCL